MTTRCERPDCPTGTGTIDEHGFCSDCARRPLPGQQPGPALPALPAPRTAVGPAVMSLGSVPMAPAPWWGLDLVHDDHIRPVAGRPVAGRPVAGRPVAGRPDAGRNDPPDVPDAPDMSLPEVEEQRRCADCAAPVGRGHDGRPGRPRGYCPACDAPFDFTQRLEGQTLAGRYRVRRKLGHGGFAAAYLCHDSKLDTDMVLKVLPESVAKTAEKERDALVGLRHDSIVRILSYESEGPYLAIEYIPGTRLAARPDDPLHVLLAHGLRILQALDYLHSRGLLHCDVKPANILRFAEEGAAGPRDRVRLIDFGAVRAVKDTHPLDAFTEKYAPPMLNPRTGKQDPEHVRPTPGLDLFCLGRTLEELCQDRLAAEPEAPGADALRRLLRRATSVETPEHRFTSARQFAEQLSGVLRQVMPATPDHKPIIRVSVPFGSMTESLDGGLSAARPLGDWVTARLTPDRTGVLGAPFACPAPREIVAALPVPVTDPTDRHADQQASNALARCRDELREGRPDTAEWVLREARLPEWNWLRCWYGGLIALVRGDPRRAAGLFATVRDMLPGELIPSLALGLCEERDGCPEAALAYYESVAVTAPGLGAAGFGLARVHLLAGRREEAVASAKRLTTEFRFAQPARVAAARLLVACTSTADSGKPSRADLRLAEQSLKQLGLDEAARLGIEAEIEFARFAVSGDEWSGLSDAVRELARHATNERDHTALVDLANQLRPPIEWRRSESARQNRRMAYKRRTSEQRTREQRASEQRASEQRASS